MTDRFKYSKVRQHIIDDLRMDLIGPADPYEVLDENPRFAYLVGMLDVQGEDDSKENEQEIDSDVNFEDEEDYTAGEEDDNEPIMSTRFQLPSSIGISFYISMIQIIFCLMCHGEIILSPQKKSWEKTIKSITKPFIIVSLCQKH